MALDSDVRIWATAVSENVQNGRKIIFRYAKEFDASFDRACQPIRIIIVWRYQSNGGQPVAEDHDRMNLLEDSLESAINQDRFATLALVSTGEDLREWTYYAKSEDEFLARLNYAFAGMATFPIEIRTSYDPNWNLYDQFKAGVIEAKSEMDRGGALAPGSC